MVRSGVVVLLLVSSVRTVGVRDRLVHPDFCWTRDCLTSFRGDVQLNFEDRARVDSVKVLLVASKTDQNREDCTTTRVHMAEGAEVGKTPVGAFEALVEVLDAYPERPEGAPPDDETYGVWVVVVVVFSH